MLDVTFVGNFPQVNYECSLTPQNMFDQGAHLTAVLGIESIVDLDEKARSTP